MLGKLHIQQATCLPVSHTLFCVDNSECSLPASHLQLMSSLLHVCVELDFPVRVSSAAINCFIFDLTV